MSARTLVAALLFTIALPATAHAKAWTQKAGQGYAKVWARGIFGSKAFLTDGSLADSPSFQDVSLRHYVEVGLTDKWTALSYGTPVGWAHVDDNGSAYVGPLAVGIRRGFLDGPFRLALEATYGYAPPVGDDNLGAPDSQFVYLPTVSNHMGGAELQAGYGFSWGWAVASAGVQFNSNDAVDTAITGFVQVGYHLGEAVDINAHVGTYQPLGDVEVVNIAGTGQTRYVGAGFGLSWWMTDSLGLSVGLEGAPYAESNAGSPSYALGVEGRF